jgi:hypothetical protein
VFGSTLALAVGEVMVRLLDPASRDHGLPVGIFLIDSQLGWRLRPDTALLHRTEYFSVPYTINHAGYRDRVRSGPRSPGRTRVLLYGDSQVFGWGVPEGLRFSSLLEAADPRLDIWNMAVPAYGLDQQLIAYEAAGGGIDTDVVVFFVSPSTLARSKIGYIFAKYKPRFVLDSAGALALIPVPRLGMRWTIVRNRLFSPWYLPYFFDRRVGALKRRLAGASPIGEPPTDTLLSPVARAMILRTAGTARARGHRMLLLTTLTGSPLETIRGLAEEAGMGVIALDLPPEGEGLRFGIRDRHWTPRAHALVAEQIRQQWAKPASSASAGLTLRILFRTVATHSSVAPNCHMTC